MSRVLKPGPGGNILQKWWWNRHFKLFLSTIKHLLFIRPHCKILPPESSSASDRAPGVCITPSLPWLPNVQPELNLSPDTCSHYCQPNWLLLATPVSLDRFPHPAIRPFTTNTIIYKYWSLYKLCKGTNLDTRGLTSIELIYSMEHQKSYLNSLLASLLTPGSWLKLDKSAAVTGRLQMFIHLRAPVTFFVTWIRHPCAPNNASHQSPGAAAECSGVSI